MLKVYYWYRALLFQGHKKPPEGGFYEDTNSFYANENGFVGSA